MNRTKIALLGVATSAGGRRHGQEKGPQAWRRAGLVQRLEEAGIEVEDHGDLPGEQYRPDPQNAKAQNADAVQRVASSVAEAMTPIVKQCAAERSLPVVLGGDCSISLGVVAGLLTHEPNLGLFYFDGDLDLNTPETTKTGILDGMVAAHLLGEGDHGLVTIGPRVPLLTENELAFVGYDPDGGGIDPVELRRLLASTSPRFDATSVRSDPSGVARRAINELEENVQRFAVHFDIDVTRFPAVDVHHPRGLSLATAGEVLNVALAREACAALVVTELNGELDEDGVQAQSLVDIIVRALGQGVSAPSGAAWI